MTSALAIEANDLVPVGGAPSIGNVAEFDEPRGLGVIEYGPGRHLPFHCTAITDGSRQISASGPQYRGPGAPATGPLHHYTFEVYALDTKIDVTASAATPPSSRRRSARTGSRS